MGGCRGATTVYVVRKFQYDRLPLNGSFRSRVCGSLSLTKTRWRRQFCFFKWKQDIAVALDSTSLTNQFRSASLLKKKDMRWAQAKSRRTQFRLPQYPTRKMIEVVMLARCWGGIGQKSPVQNDKYFIQKKRSSQIDKAQSLFELLNDLTASDRWATKGHSYIRQR